MSLLKSYRFLLCAVAVHFFVVLFAALHFGATAKNIFLTVFPLASTHLTILCALPMGNAVRAVTVWRKQNSFLKNLQNYLSEIESLSFSFFKTPRAAESILLFVTIFPFFVAFSIGKSLIPFFHQFSWDPAFSRFDFLLHFRHFPHDLLPNYGQFPFLIGLAEYTYMAWFLVLPVFYGYVIFFEENQKQRKICLWGSFILWSIFGNLMATLFSSSGPIFYDDFVAGANPYAGLHADMLNAKESGSVLWSGGYDFLMALSARHLPCDINGISAFPSMHVGESMLACLYAFTVSRKIGWGMAVYTLMILASSIMLGFHYAIDGYFIIAAVALMWWALNRIYKPNP